MKAACVYVKLENGLEITPFEIANGLFGSPNRILDKWEPGFSVNNKYNVVIEVLKKGVRILNRDYVDRILIHQDSKTIKDLNLLFDNPKFIIAYLHNDTEDSFGFCYVENKKVRRIKYSLNAQSVEVDVGDPLDEEKNILDGTYFNSKEDDYELLYHKKDNSEKIRSYHYICSDLADDVLVGKTGYGIDDDDEDQVLERLLVDSSNSTIDDDSLYTQLYPISGIGGKSLILEKENLWLSSIKFNSYDEFNLNRHDIQKTDISCIPYMSISEVKVSENNGIITIESRNEDQLYVYNSFDMKESFVSYEIAKFIARQSNLWIPVEKQKMNKVELFFEFIFSLFWFGMSYFLFIKDDFNLQGREGDVKEKLFELLINTLGKVNMAIILLVVACYFLYQFLKKISYFKSEIIFNRNHH